MKKLVASILLIASYAVSAIGQSYNPTTMWPYINKEFAHGTVIFSDNTKKDGVFNIHLLNCELHSLDKNNIISVTNKDIVRVDIADKGYIFIDNELCEIIAASPKAIAVKRTKGDFDKLLTGTGAYGSSLNTSGKTDLSSIEIGGMHNTDHNDMRSQRDNSRYLPVKVTKYIIYNGKTVEVTKKNVLSLIPEEKQAEWKIYVKENKIKYGKEESLPKIIDYLTAL